MKENTVVVWQKNTIKAMTLNKVLRPTKQLTNILITISVLLPTYCGKAHRIVIFIIVPAE